MREFKLWKKQTRRNLAYVLAFFLAVCVIFVQTGKVRAASASPQVPVTPDSIGVTDTITIRPGGQQSDRAIIQEALDNAQQCNGILKVVLTAGTYYVDSPLYVYSNTWIYANDGVTVLNTSRNGDPLIFNATDVAGTAEPGRHENNENIFVTGGTWDGNKDITDKVCNIMMFRHCNNVIISGCTFQNSVDHMLNLSGSGVCLVENCTFKDQKRLTVDDESFFKDGLSEDKKEGRYMSVEVLHLDYMNEAGELQGLLDGTPPENITIRGCTFSNVFSGLGTHHTISTTKGDKNYATGYAKNIVIEGNTFKNVMGPCISAYSFSDATVSGNTATNVGQLVNFYGSTNCVVSGTNKVTGCWQGATPYEQHQINIENSNGISISGVTAAAGTSYAEDYNLYITGSKNITVSSSSFSQAGKYAVMVKSSSGVKINSKCNLSSAKTKSIDIEDSTDVTVDGNTLSGAVMVQNSSAKLNSNTISGGEDTIFVTGGTSSNHAVITNNTVKSSTSNGIQLRNYKGTAEISGNTISGSGNNAILGYSCSGLEIKNNSFSGIKSHVVNFESVSNSKVMSNSFGTLASGKKGLRIYKSNGITVSGNNLSASDIIDEESSGIAYIYADTSYTGVTKYSGSLYYVKKGVVDKSFTGFAKYDSKWYYVEKGLITLTTNTIAKGAVNGETAWWNVKNSVVVFSDTVAKDSKGDWYAIIKGKSDGSYSGFLSDGKDWWYVQNGRLTFDKTGVYKGTINGKTGWYYAEGSKYTKATKIAKNQVNGTWWRVKDGTLDFSFTDFYQNDTGWWYCKNGQVMFENTGVYKGTINGKTGWWYVKNGKYTKDTLIAKNKVNNTWWRVKDGTLDFGFTGFYQNDTGWWYCKNGQITFSDTGVYKGTINGKTGWYYVEGSKYTKATKIAKNKVNNTWWRVKDGTLDFSFTGFYQNDTGWWYCKNGQITFAETGVFKGTIDGVTGYYYAKGSKFTKIDTIAKNDAGYWVVQNGKVNFNYTGIWSNNSGQWYCVKGKVDFGYTGTVKFNGKTYKIKEGKVE